MFNFDTTHLRTRLKNTYRDCVLQRIALAMYLLGKLGHSTTQDLLLDLSQKLAEYGDQVSPNAGSLRRLIWDVLEPECLIKLRPEKLVRGANLAVVQLTDFGHYICNLQNWKIVESDWQRLVRLHNAEEDTRHAVVILALAYQLRLRGSQVMVVPYTRYESIYPDLLVTTPTGNGSRRMYVEVQLRQHGDLEKWEKYRLLQNYVAVCTLTSDSTPGVMREIQRAGMPGYATDIETVIYRSKKYPEMVDIWVESWQIREKRVLG